MIKQRARFLVLATIFLDLAALALAFRAAYWVRDTLLTRALPSLFPHPLFELRTYAWMIPVMLCAWVGLFYAFRLYEAGRLTTFKRLLANLAQANLLGIGLVVGVAYLLKLQDISRTFLILFGVGNLLAISGGRLLLRALLHRTRRRGRAVRNVVIVGTGPDALELAGRVCRQPLGMNLVGLLAEQAAGETAGHGEIAANLPILGDVTHLERVLSQHVVDEVIFVIPGRTPSEYEDAFLLCEDLGINARIAMGIFPHLIAKARLEEFDGIPLLTFTTVSTNTLALAVKRFIDLVAGLALFALFALPGALIAVLIKLDSRGPVIFGQERVGLHGRMFRMYKFRSMVADAEGRQAGLIERNEMRGPVFKIRDDRRITRFGRVLRRTSLDELPQIINILKGDMSLVGPRPPIPREVERYARWQRRRLSMKPGITCLWQVSGRNEIDFEEWIALDLKYIDSWSLWLDLKILLRTIPAVLSGRGAS